jgi:hypothetical protein
LAGLDELPRRRSSAVEQLNEFIVEHSSPRGGGGRSSRFSGYGSESDDGYVSEPEAAPTVAFGSARLSSRRSSRRSSAVDATADGAANEDVWAAQFSFLADAEEAELEDSPHIANPRASGPDQSPIESGCTAGSPPSAQGTQVAGTDRPAPADDSDAFE